MFKDNLETIIGKRPYETSKVEAEAEKTEEEEYHNFHTNLNFFLFNFLSLVC